MTNEFIPLSVPNFQGNELKYASDAVATEWVSTAGSYVSRFEESIAEYVHAPKAAAVQSGTAGLHLALICCGIKPDDEVLVPTLTFIAAVNPVRYVGAHPVFMDCDDSLCMDPVKVARFCEEECDFDGEVLIDRESGRPVRAVVVVHVFGNMADMGSLVDIAKRYNLKLIEDATEALGSYVNEGCFEGRFAGTIGDVGVYSFNGNKIITCGGGGAVVSQDEAIVEHAKHLSTQAKVDQVRFVHDEVGYNYRMTNVQAAIGLAQMEQLEGFIEIKRYNYQLYQELGIELLPFRDSVRSNCWFYSYMANDRDALLEKLSNEKIQARPIWYLIHQQEMYKNDRSYQIDCAARYWEHIVNIPCSTNLEKCGVERVTRMMVSLERDENSSSKLARIRVDAQRVTV